MDLHPDPLGALQRAIDAAPEADRAWLQSRWRAFLQAGGRVRLEHALRLPVGARQWARLQRDELIRQAASHLASAPVAHKARALASLLNRMSVKHGYLATVPSDPVIANLVFAIRAARAGGASPTLRWRQVTTILQAVAIERSAYCNGEPVPSEVTVQSPASQRNERFEDASVDGCTRRGSQART
ncbi:MAG: hypothetical protein AB7P21_00225 [Lautropia sp.]